MRSIRRAFCRRASRVSGRVRGGTGGGRRERFTLRVSRHGGGAMKRRTFVMATGMPLAALVDYAWPAYARAGETKTDVQRSPAFVLADQHLARGRELARLAARAGFPVIEIGDDVGMPWHTTLVQRLTAKEASFVGVVRASDAFVLARLAARSHRIEQRTTQRDGVVEVWIETGACRFDTHTDEATHG